MHIELTVNAMELAAHVDEMILFSGDGERTWEFKQPQHELVNVLA